MNDERVSQLPDADMRGVLSALRRAGQRAREIARQTGTAVVVMRDGKLVEERDTPTEPAATEPFAS